jgi:hypothetical protein
MLASRRRISPDSSNSQCSFPWLRHHCPVGSRDSYSKRTEILFSWKHQSSLRSIVELPLPLTGQELDDRLPAAEELVAVSPLGLGGVGECDPLRIARVPGVLGGLDLLSRHLFRERRNGRARAHDVTVTSVPIRV